MLYPCKPIRAEAAVYFNAGRNSACAKASANTEHVNKPHATQRLRQTHFFELLRKNMGRNIRGINFEAIEIPNPIEDFSSFLAK